MLLTGSGKLLRYCLLPTARRPPSWLEEVIHRLNCWPLPALVKDQVIAVSDRNVTTAYARDAKEDTEIADTCSKPSTGVPWS